MLSSCLGLLTVLEIGHWISVAKTMTLPMRSFISYHYNTNTECVLREILLNGCKTVPNVNATRDMAIYCNFDINEIVRLRVAKPNQPSVPDVVSTSQSNPINSRVNTHVEFQHNRDLEPCLRHTAVPGPGSTTKRCRPADTRRHRNVMRIA